MRINLVMLLTVLILHFPNAFAQKDPKEPNNDQIILEGQVPPGYNSEEVTLATFPVFLITYQKDESRDFTQKVKNGSVKWAFASNKTLFIKNPLIKKPSYIGYTLEPGDSISVRYEGEVPVFSGKGIEKWNLVYQLEKLSDSLKNTTLFKGLSREHAPINSLEDYFAWNNYLNIKRNCLLPVIDSYRTRISNYIYNALKEKVLYDIEEKRVGKFFMLIGGKVQDGQTANEFGVTNQDLCTIYDSTLYGPGARWLQFEAPLVGDPYYLWHILALDALREKKKFFKLKPTDPSLLGDRAASYVLRYNLAKKKYKGLIREEVLAFCFHYARGVFYNVGFEPEVEDILRDYYKQSKYPEYQYAVKQYELNQRSKQTGKRDIGFILTDTKGQSFTKDELKGKIAILDFWFTGCTGCVQMTPALHKVEEAFKSDTNIIFLNVSVDKNKAQWLNSITQKKYTTGNGVNVFTSGEGTDHQMVKNYGIEAYPTLLVFDQGGKILPAYPHMDPRLDEGKKLTDLVRQQLILMKDGPYVLDAGENVTAYSLNGMNITTKDVTKNTILSVQTDTETTFKITLKPSLAIEPDEYPHAERLFVLSDIEGNFSAFRKLLQSNNIIDDDFNWTFGDGHLVFAGDMFDRGNQVTECLWLIYSLEEKAKAAGGYVHFILGNHEIMNLQGDHKYTQAKYKDNARLVGKTITQLYNENSELGRWLRTKNIIEKIGDLLFTHGGISTRMNAMEISIQEINSLARPFYAVNKPDYLDRKVNTIMSEYYGPLWYRGYYQGKPLENQLDSTLRKYAVSHIITGHTIVADTISVHYGGKVINTDTRHAAGKSEALLIEGSHFYRVNAEGRKSLLFVSPGRKKDFLSTLPIADRMPSKSNFPLQ